MEQFMKHYTWLRAYNWWSDRWKKFAHHRNDHAYWWLAQSRFSPSPSPSSPFTPPSPLLLPSEKNLSKSFEAWFLAGKCFKSKILTFLSSLFDIFFREGQRCIWTLAFAKMRQSWKSLYRCISFGSLLLLQFKLCFRFPYEWISF